MFETYGCKINRANNQLKDNNIIDYVNVRNLGVEIGGRRYTEDSWDLD